MDKSRQREALDAFDDEVMSVIAQGSPDAQRGKFSSDPGARQAALAAPDFPFHRDEMRGGWRFDQREDDIAKAMAP